MKVVTQAALEEAVRMLGLPVTLEVKEEWPPPTIYYSHANYSPPTPTITATFEIPLTPEIKRYLPEMRARYENWVALQRFVNGGESPL